MYHAPPCLTDELSRPADSLARCKLCSASSSILVVCRTRLTTVGDRSNPIAASREYACHHVTFPSSLWKSSEDSFIFFFFSLTSCLYILFVKCLWGDFCHFYTLIVVIWWLDDWMVGSHIRWIQIDLFQARWDVRSLENGWDAADWFVSERFSKKGAKTSMTDLSVRSR